MSVNVVYVLCPSKLITGGTEALHQLVDGIVRLGGNSQIVYFDEKTIGLKKFVPVKFRHYRIKVASSIEDNERNAVVVPEVSAHLLNRFSSCQKYFWWLSADYCTEESIEILKTLQVTHLYQSEYARLKLEQEGFVKHYPLSDYIVSYPINKRHNKTTIAVAAQKNDIDYEILQELIFQRYPCTLVKNKSRIGLSKLFSKSRLFVDLGHHPGKDRLPREAVYLGCSLLTSNNGSCRNELDVPINPDYKIDAKTSQDDFIYLVNKVMTSASSDHNLNTYIQKITKEKIQFFGEISEIFGLPEAQMTQTSSCFKFYFWSYVEHCYISIRNIIRFNK